MSEGYEIPYLYRDVLFVGGMACYAVDSGGVRSGDKRWVSRASELTAVSVHWYQYSDSMQAGVQQTIEVWDVTISTCLREPTTATSSRWVRRTYHVESTRSFEEASALVLEALADAFAARSIDVLHGLHLDTRVGGEGAELARRAHAALTSARAKRMWELACTTAEVCTEDVAFIVPEFAYSYWVQRKPRSVWRQKKVQVQVGMPSWMNQQARPYALVLHPLLHPEMIPAARRAVHVLTIDHLEAKDMTHG